MTKSKQVDRVRAPYHPNRIEHLNDRIEGLGIADVSVLRHVVAHQLRSHAPPFSRVSCEEGGSPRPNSRAAAKERSREERAPEGESAQEGEEAARVLAFI